MSTRYQLRLEVALHAGQFKTTHIQVSVYYSKGGSNFFHGTLDQRGVYVSVGPMEVLPGGQMRFVLTKGCRHCLLHLGRDSQKRVDEVWEGVLQDIAGRTGTVWEMVQRVLREENLSLTYADIPELAQAQAQEEAFA